MAAAATPGPVPVDATDPRLQYHGAWKYDPNDPAKNTYHNGTFQITSGNGDYVTFDWTGGDLTIVGSTKPDHGFYSISLDSSPKMYYDGYAATPVDRTILWASKGLAIGAHRVELRNENVYMQSSTTKDRLVLDVDYMSYIPGPQAAPPAEPSKPAASPKPEPSSSTAVPAVSSAPQSSSVSETSETTSMSTVTSISQPGSSAASPVASSISTVPPLSSSVTSTSTAVTSDTYDFAIKMAITTGTPKLANLTQ